VAQNELVYSHYVLQPLNDVAIGHVILLIWEPLQDELAYSQKLTEDLCTVMRQFKMNKLLRGILTRNDSRL